MSGAPDPVIFEAVGKRYRRGGETVDALADVSLSIASGEILVVIGLSGSGKSTLLRLVNRLIAPSSGRVLVDGVDLAGLDAKALRRLRRERVAMVFQAFALLPHLSVRDNIAFGKRIAGAGRAEAREAAEPWGTAVGLGDWLGARPDALSGGMRQRVGLARALATGAEILLLDEPFGALDPITRREMQDLLRDLHARHGRTLLFVTHDMREALDLADRIAVLREGRLVQIATPANLQAQPADPYVERLLEAG